MTIFTRHKTPTRTVIQRHLTPAQLAWMKQHVEYERLGRRDRASRTTIAAPFTATARSSR
jgi:hypothetical protein